MSATKGEELRGILHPSDTYIILDLEWNQPIPWIKSKVDPKELPGEIIEIGAVKLTAGATGISLSRPFHVLIRPVCYTIMNKNVSRVINKISSDLRHGLSFTDAYDSFIQWCGQDFVICGWGNSDLSILKTNLRFHDRSAILGKPFLDVQTLFSKVAEEGNDKRSVEYAVDFLRIPKQDDFHEAHRDADYTGRILKAIFEIIEKDGERTAGRRNSGMEPETAGISPKTKRCDIFRLEQYLFDPDLNVQSERRTDYFPSWEECCRRTFTEEALCPACGSPMKEELGWFRIRKSAFSLFRCDRHNLTAGRIRLKKNPEKKIYGTVTFKLIQPGEAVLTEDRYAEYSEFGAEGKPRAVVNHADGKAQEDEISEEKCETIHSD